MIVEFQSVRSSLKEDWEKEKVNELGIGTSNDFFNKEDYIAVTAVELDNVIDYQVGKVWYNEKRLNCVNARMFDDYTTINLLVTGEEFKSILEYSKGIKIKTSKEILNITINESNTKSI